MPYRSVIARRALKHDPFELGEAVAAEPQDGLEALAAEFACVECPAKLIDAWALLFEDLIAGGFNQDQVPWAPFAVSEPNEACALLRVETLDRHDDTLTCVESLQDRHIKQLTRTCLDLIGRYSTTKQGMDSREREHCAPFLDDAFGEPVRLRRRRADDQQQAAGRVAKTIGGTEDASAHRHVGRPWRRTVTARTL